jgi:hypothetical protein
VRGGIIKPILSERGRSLGKLKISSKIASPPSETLFMRWEATGLRNVDD